MPNQTAAARAMIAVAMAVASFVVLFAGAPREACAQRDFAAASAASVTAEVVSPAAGSAAPTQTIQLGVFGLTNNSTGVAVAVNSVTLTFSDPGLFSSTTLSAVGASPSVAAPPAANNVYNFTIPPVIQAGQELTFSLTVTMANTTSRNETGGVAYAGMITAPAFTGETSPLWIGFVAIGLVSLVLTADRRWRVWLVAAAILLLAATAPGCGSTTGGGSDEPTGSSGQSLTAVAAVAVPFGGGALPSPVPVTISGLPLNLGSITRT